EVVVATRIALLQQRARQRLAVDVDDVAAHLDGIAAARDHTLDVVATRIARVSEHDHVTRLERTGLVDQQVIADLEGRIHRARRNLERLGQEYSKRERAADEHDGHYKGPPLEPAERRFSRRAITADERIDERADED